MLLAQFKLSFNAHNGARWSELTLTPWSHLGPFNDLQIYHLCLRELAGTSWGRCHGLLLASSRRGWVSPGSVLQDDRVSVLTGKVVYSNR